MTIGRTVLALLIALSVAMLPAAGAAGMNSHSPAAADMSVMEDMRDCCPHKANPCDDCGTMAACALKCFSFAGASSSAIVFPLNFAKVVTTFVGNPLSSQTSSPPFRPPRV
jgi:hypothetical protein